MVSAFKLKTVSPKSICNSFFNLQASVIAIVNIEEETFIENFAKTTVFFLALHLRIFKTKFCDAGDRRRGRVDIAVQSFPVPKRHRNKWGYAVNFW